MFPYIGSGKLQNDPVVGDMTDYEPREVVSIKGRNKIMEMGMYKDPYA